jgi:hypothetical protein
VADAQNPSVKRAFEEAAVGWLVLGGQMEWIDREPERKTGAASATCSFSKVRCPSRHKQLSVCNPRAAHATTLMYPNLAMRCGE